MSSQNKNNPHHDARVILVVDDEVSFREMVVETLKNEGHTVYECNNGQEALDIINKTHIDIVLSDIRMPVMNGMDLLKHVQELSKDKPKVVMMTGASQYSKDDAVSAGAETLIEKTDIWGSLVKIISSIRFY